MKLLISGGWNWSQYDYDALRAAIKSFDPAIIAHTGLPGPNNLSLRIARELAIPEATFPGLRPHWTNHGQTETERYNDRLIRTFKPDAVLAAPGGKVTNDMATRALKAGIPVHFLEPQSIYERFKARTAAQSDRHPQAPSPDLERE